MNDTKTDETARFFWDHPDNGPTPAHSWRWMIGNVWAATHEQSDADWWGYDTPSANQPEIHTYPISELPPSGALSFYDHEGNYIFVGTKAGPCDPHH